MTEARADEKKPYYRINDRETPEPEKRWLSWTVLVRQGRKQSYIKPAAEEIAKRRKKAKAARRARRANRG